MSLKVYMHSSFVTLHFMHQLPNALYSYLTPLIPHNACGWAFCSGVLTDPSARERERERERETF